jgi:hypothetical protein
MKPTRVRATLCLLLAPAAALAFDAADSVVFPSTGRFPAYPPELTRVAPGVERPTTAWAQIGVMRDTNVLRLSDQVGKQSDTVFRYGLGVRHETRLGRQRIILGADADYYDFDRFNALDHLAYRLLGEARWELGNNWTGTAGYTRRQVMADLGEIQVPREDLIVTDRGYFTAAYRISPDFRLRAGLEGLTTGREGDALAGIDTDTRSLTLGADYLTPLGNAIGIEARRTDGELRPVGAAAPILDPNYKETELSGVLTYNPGPRTRVTGRLGRTERSFDGGPGRDFSGGTGRFSAEWGLTPRTILEGEVWREARSILDVAASHVDSRGWLIGARWAPTARIAVSARVTEEQRKYNRADPVLALLVPAGPRPTDETIRLFRLGVGYEFTRRIHLALGWDYGERSSDLARRSYDFNALSFNARWNFW